MKKYILIIMCIALVGCIRSNTESETIPVQLETPASLNITVVGRLMTVRWTTVENASGYLVHTTSLGCSSGNRIVNTATGTVTSHTGAAMNSASAVNGITDRGNGFVTFTGTYSFTIWLMPEAGSETEVMATSLVVNIRAIGDGVNYTDSEPSSDFTLNKINFR